MQVRYLLLIKIFKDPFRLKDSKGSFLGLKNFWSITRKIQVLTYSKYITRSFKFFESHCKPNDYGGHNEISENTW